MKISVVVANWNYERYLEPCILSVLGQDHVAVELILVDDGSTDGSREIMSSYSGSAKVVFKPNGGQASAFNSGFAVCTGDLVLFLDADDLLRPDALRRVAAAWRQGVSKIHFPLEVIDEHGKALGARVPRAGLGSGNLQSQVLARGLYMSPPSSGNVYSREFLSQVMPVPEKGWPYADAYLISLAPLYGDVVAIEASLGQYRRHSRSATGVGSGEADQVKRKLETMFQVELSIRKLLESACGRLGLTLSDQAVSGHWLHLKTKLAVLKLRQEPAARLARESWGLVKAVWRAPEVGLKARALFTVWAVLVAALPQCCALGPIQFAFAAGDRKSLAAWCRSASATPNANHGAARSILNRIRRVICPFLIPAGDEPSSSGG